MAKKGHKSISGIDRQIGAVRKKLADRNTKIRKEKAIKKKKSMLTKLLNKLKSGHSKRRR